MQPVLHEQLTINEEQCFECSLMQSGLLSAVKVTILALNFKK